MTWNWKKELEKKQKKYPHDILHVDPLRQRIETDKEYENRLEERNIGFDTGIVVGIFLGFDVSLIFDLIQKVFLINTYIETISIIIITSILFWVIKKFRKGNFYVY